MISFTENPVEPAANRRLRVEVILMKTTIQVVLKKSQRSYNHRNNGKTYEWKTYVKLIQKFMMAKMVIKIIFWY